MSRAKTSPVSLREDVHRGGRPTVDRERGVIQGVKVLGLESANGRRYLPEATRAAAALYEGRSVRINHPRRPDDSRDAGDVFGKLRDVRRDDAGELWGDLWFLKSHPMAERVCEAAERMPDLFGLSHNAEGNVRREDGVDVVYEITEVRSVDLVADPATTGGLFEERRQVKKVKLRTFLEGVEAKLDQAKRNRLKALLKEDAPLYGEDMAEPDMPAEATPDDQLKSGFNSAGVALLDAALDGDEDAAKKLIKLIKAHCKLAGGAEDAPEEEDVEEGEGCDDEDDKPMKEELERLKRKDAVRDLCEAEKVVPTPALLKALLALDSAADRKALIAEHRGAAGQQQRGRPRTQGVSEGRQGAGAVQVPAAGSTPEQLGRWLCGAD